MEPMKKELFVKAVLIKLRAVNTDAITAVNSYTKLTEDEKQEILKEVEYRVSAAE